MMECFGVCIVKLSLLFDPSRKLFAANANIICVG